MVYSNITWIGSKKKLRSEFECYNQFLKMNALRQWQQNYVCLVLNVKFYLTDGILNNLWSTIQFSNKLKKYKDMQIALKLLGI